MLSEFIRQTILFDYANYLHISNSDKELLIIQKFLEYYIKDEEIEQLIES